MDVAQKKILKFLFPIFSHGVIKFSRLLRRETSLPIRWLLFSEGEPEKRLAMRISVKPQETGFFKRKFVPVYNMKAYEGVEV